MALFKSLPSIKAPPIKKPKNLGTEISNLFGSKALGKTFGVGPDAQPGSLHGGADKPMFQGELQKPISETIQASPLEIGPPGGKTPTLADISNPYEEAARMATGQISGMLPQYGQLYGTGAGAMTGLIGDLQAQARGQAGPGKSLAEALLQQGLTQNVGAVQSQLASQRGLSAAQRGRMLAGQTAALQGQSAQQAGIMGLQQQLAAQEMLGKLGTGAAQLGSDAQIRGAGLLTGQSQEQEKMRQNIAAANQAAAAQDKARTVNAVTSVLGGAAQVGAGYAGRPALAAAPATTPTVAAAHGGRIDGTAPYAGDTPKNDVVPANLSPGEIVIPRTAAGSKKEAKKFIDALDDWDEEPSYGKVLKARQKNYADGGVVPNDEQMMQEAGQAYLEKQRAPYPVVQKAKEAFDDLLTRKVVEPMAERGYPTLGAALATVPSTAMEAMVPSTPDELMQTVIPFPGAKLTKKAEKAIAKEGSEVIEKKLAEKILDQRGIDEPDYVRQARNPKTVLSNQSKKAEKAIAKEGGKKVLSELERSKLQNKRAKELFTKSEDEIDKFFEKQEDVFAKPAEVKPIETDKFANLKSLEKAFQNSDEFKELQLFTGNKQVMKQGKLGLLKGDYYDALNKFLYKHHHEAGPKFNKLKSEFDRSFDRVLSEDELDYFM